MLPSVYRNSSIEWKPSPVVALATSPDHSQVAAAREDGSLEIWLVVPSAGWHCYLNIHGDPRSRISSLVWCRTGSRDRLLSSSIDGSIHEWDLLHLKQKVVLESNAVSIWQIAVVSSDCESIESEDDSKFSNLAVACDDSCVRIYRIPDSGDLIYESKLVTVNGRVLSVTWSLDGSELYSGSSDGFIRCWDVKSRREKYRITVDGTGNCIWSLLALRRGTLVSADSTGSVRFWDSRHGTLIQTHSYHNGDVNALAASPNHNRVFSAGSDGQVILYELASEMVGSGDVTTPSMKKWVYVRNVRAHTHDIRALAIAMPIKREDNDNEVKRTRRRRRVFESSFHKWAHLGVPMLISGGDDTKLFAYSVKEFSKFSFHDICPVPLRLPIQLVCNTLFDNSSLILVQGLCSLDIYCVSTKNGTSKGRATLDLTARVEAKASRKIICSTISNSGKLFAYSDHTKRHLFELKKHRVGSRIQWSVNKIQLPQKLPYALSLIFSSDSSRLMIAGHDRRIYVVNVHKTELVHTFIPCRDENKELPSCEHPITKMFTSSNGRWLAAIDCIGGIYVFNLETQRQHWFVSRLNGASVTAGGFPPQDNNMLVVTTSSNQVFELDVEAKQLGKWSMQHTSVLPKRYQEISGEVLGLSFFPKSKPPSVIVYSARAMCLINFRTDQEEDYNMENVQQNSVNGTLKRKCEDYVTKPKNKRNFEFYVFRDPVLFMGHLSDDSILVIDKPWIDVVKTFDTAPVHRHIYGT